MEDVEIFAMEQEIIRENVRLCLDVLRSGYITPDISEACEEAILVGVDALQVA